MNRKLKVSELENGKNYKTDFHQGEKVITKRSGDLIYGGTFLTDHLTLDDVLELEFVEVEQEVNPYSKITDTEHYFVEYGGRVEWDDVPISKSEHEYGNCYKDEAFAEWKAKERKLLNSLERFSYENGGSQIDWNDEDQRKYEIYQRYSPEYNLGTRRVINNRDMGQVYFISEEIAEQALEKYRDLIEEVYFQDKY